MDEHNLLHPADSSDFIGSEQQFFAEHPSSSLNHEVTNTPCLLIDHEIVDITQPLVFSNCRIALELFKAAQVRIASVGHGGVGEILSGGEQPRVGALRPQAEEAPIVGLALVWAAPLVLKRNWRIAVDAWAMLDLVLTPRYLQTTLGPVRTVDGARRKQATPIGKEMA